MTQFSGQTAFVTGGSRGIGRSIAERLVNDGAKVAVMDVNEEALAEVREHFSDQDVLAIKADVTNRNEVEGAMKEAYEAYGSIDILVNNAGVIRDNMLFKMTEDDWQTVMDVHLKGSFNAASVAQEYMVKQKYGRIINLSSNVALGNRGQANYSTAKAGLQGFTKTLAIELGKFNITTNAIAPGFIETDMTRATAERLGITFEKLVEASVANIPVARSGKPEDIANAAAFFADKHSSFVNGQVLYVAGGPMA
ncbi:SDR family oxidoreductase [Salicibibacter halophilus]|uniref:SDR family oxidoreductase n=1 Tax=Salicibibacter halophilus TaxID=2502791 RepID=A0A514LF71_9BACI|nr:3-oxoacyl-ACP reductase FabG [Salicibibacter halophilus]QDI90500.1 SDR family oxidoreductase [Salicibibacter halophilus]